MAESDKSNLDSAAAQLQAKADEVLKSTVSDEEAAKAGGKTESLRKIAKIVKEQADKGLGSSKEFLSGVISHVSAYASEATKSTSTQFAEAKERGLSHAEAAKEIAGTHLTSAKEAASTHLHGVHTNLNKAIAQGQAKGTASGTTDRALATDSEPLSFPFNLISWFVSLCHGKGVTTASTEYSDSSLHNAAASLSESFGGAGQSVKDAGEKDKAGKPSASDEVKASKSSSSSDSD